MQQNLVSIIMAAYNAERYIEQAIGSVQAQSYAQWELLVVDDGSQDATASIVERLAQGDRRIRLFRQANKGVSAARNVALAAMRGEFFLIFDSDDVLPSESLRLRVEKMRENAAIWFVDGWVSQKNDQLNERIRWRKPDFRGSPHEALMRLDMRCFSVPSWLVRREKGAPYAMREGMSHAEDLLFYIDISRDKMRLYDYVEEKVLIYRIHDNMAMRKLDGLERGYIQLFKILKSEFNISWGTRCFLRYKIMRIMFLSYLRQRQWGKALRSLWRTLVM